MITNYYNKRLQRIGWLSQGVYRKVVSKKKHLFRVMDAWGIEASVVRELDSKKCKQIRIKELDNNIVYVVSFNEFKKKGVTRTFETEQVFLPRKYFDTLYDR